jgi:hypothetical protein
LQLAVKKAEVKATCRNSYDFHHKQDTVPVRQRRRYLTRSGLVKKLVTEAATILAAPWLSVSSRWAPPSRLARHRAPGGVEPLQ